MQLKDLTKIPHQSYKLPNSFFNIINFTPTINTIYSSCIEKASELNTDLNLKSSIHKKYIYHYLILYSCEFLKLNNKKYKPVIYFDIRDDLTKKLMPFFKVFLKNFPILSLQDERSFYMFKNGLRCPGEKDELAVYLMRELFKLQSKKFYFSKLQYFCKKYKLTFLDKTYFDDVRNKLSLL